MRNGALITGGAKRIGKELSLFLAQLNYDIALHYQSSYELAYSLSEEIKKKGVQCHLFQCNLEKENEVLNLIPQVNEKLPNLTLLINNASVFDRSPLIDTELDLFNSNFNINFKAPFFLSRDFVRYFKKGQILNILDSKVAHNDKNYIAYTLSKKVLADFTKLSALELVPHVRVNAIAPGYILAPENVPEDYLKERAKKIPLQKVGQPSYLCQALEFLINHEFITGQIIYVDGGEHL